MFDFDKFILSLTVLGLLALCISNYFRDNPSFYYNGSESADIGWYKIVPSEDYATDDIVVAILPEDARILADERHRNVQTVYLGYAEERSYPDWRMRAYTSDQSPLHMLNEAQRVFIRCADPLGSELDFETTWIGSFMRSMCRDHLPVGAPDPSKFN